jgi:type II secretory pathway component HofQ
MMDFSGERISLNFENIELRSVLQILADFTKLNIVATDTVGGSINLHLNDVPWDQAFDFILNVKGLAKRETGNIVLVASVAEINQLIKMELEAKKVVEELGPLRTEHIQLNHASAEALKDILTADSKILSPRGTVITDARTNMLIVKDMAPQLEEVKKLIAYLDVQQEKETANQEVNTEDKPQQNLNNKVRKKPEKRQDNLTKAILAACESFGKKPPFEELWQFFQNDKDETGYIADFTDTHLTWCDTRGNMQDTQKESVANRLSRLNYP